MISHDEECSEDWEDNESWECYLCCDDFPFSHVAFGWLADCHPICKRCTTEILSERDNPNRGRLTTLFSSQCYLQDLGL